MHLKTLTLRGFKSFASATTLRLEPGITCVVGPNGSGKSNVVDALAWVMGEQGAKNLRGGQMADVIFAGTSSKPALGRAQVELTIDNSDGLLDIDYSEVTISRTLFRGGGSEYHINGTPARLLDVQELLSDTGMGRQMHVIVGQGQLDAILSSTPEERRGFIEEAAGVLKHRRRKERALRKLADMDQNLVRVLDLTNELHRQLGPLARQAKIARRASNIQARLRDAQARLLADDLVNAKERLQSQSGDYRALQERQRALEEKIQLTRSTLHGLENDEAHSTPRLEQANEVWRELTALHEQLRGTHMAARERQSLHAHPLAAPTGEDPDSLDDKAAEAGRQDALLIERVEQARTALTNHIRLREEAEEEDAQAARELARVNRVLADHREKAARLSGDVSSATSRLEAAKNESERAERALEGARQREQDTRIQLDELPEESDESERSGAAEAHAHAIERRDAARARVDELLAQEREARAERAKWEARRDTLHESLTPADSTLELLGREGILGELLALIHVTPGFEEAANALLVPFTGAVLVESLERGLAELERLRAREDGLVRMVIAHADDDDICTDDAAVTDIQPDDALAELPRGAYWAWDIIDAPAGVRHALNDLFTGAVVVDDDADIHAVLATPGVQVVVTARGDLYRTTRILASGTHSSSVLTVRAQFDEAQRIAEDMAHRLETAQIQLVEANGQLDRAVRGANDALRALRDEDAERAAHAQTRARIQSALGAAQAERERAETVYARSMDQIQWAKEQVDDAVARMKNQSELAPEENLDLAQRHAQEASSSAKEMREKETKLRLELRALEEQSRQIQGKARSLRQAAAREREERVRFARQEAARLRAYERAREVAEGAALAVEAAAQALAEAERERAQAQEERTKLSSSVTQIRRDLDRMTLELGELTSATHRDEIAREQTLMQIAQLEERAMEDLSVEADALIEEFGPHNLVPLFDENSQLRPHTDSASGTEGDDGENEVTGVPFVRGEIEKQLRQAQRDLDKLGRVNPLALEEHEALKKRHEFLVAQVQDLKKSKSDLLHIIDDVDRLVQEAFTEAFEDTRREFAHIFEVLFPGGEGDLVLTDPESMLDTGIDIEARPAGKKVKRLSLLSGGERSLAAIAFLVAIFKARPSPFYVMDEVEAALDDINLSRLLTIFKELRQESQLIVVTHQKRTMEIADALYGVTMRQGVTSVVSQRLDS